MKIKHMKCLFSIVFCVLFFFLFCSNEAYAIIYNEAFATHVAMEAIGNFYNSTIRNILDNNELGYLKGDTLKFSIIESGRDRFETWVEKRSSSIDPDKTYSGWSYITNISGIPPVNRVSSDGTISFFE